MNLRDLDYVVAVAELGSFSRAAVSCGVSQPSLSTQVRKLEEEIGIEIFSRSHRKVELTPLGEKVFELSKQILSLQRKIEGLSHDEGASLQGKIRLGAILTVAPYVFAGIVSHLRKQEPGLELVLKEAKTEELLADLIDGKIDAAILSLPTDPMVFESHVLHQDPFYLVMSEGHPLSKKSSIDEEDLKNEKVILLEEGHCFRDQALTLCSTLNARENPAFRATSFETIRPLVAAGEGVTLLPAIAKKNYDALHYLPMQGKGFSRQLGIVWKKNSRQRPSLDRLRVLVQEALSSQEAV